MTNIWYTLQGLFVKILAKVKNYEFFSGQMAAKYHFGLKNVWLEALAGSKDK